MKRAVLEAVASRAIATGADLKLFAELTLLHHTDMASPHCRTRDTVSLPMLGCSGHCCIGPKSKCQSGGCVRFQCALSHHASKISALPASQSVHWFFVPQHSKDEVLLLQKHVEHYL